MEQGAILNVSAPPPLPVRRLRAWLAARQAPLPRRHRAIKGLAKTEKSRDLMRALPRKSSGFFAGICCIGWRLGSGSRCWGAWTERKPGPRLRLSCMDQVQPAWTKPSTRVAGQAWEPAWMDETPRAGFEPATNRLTADRSTTELPRNEPALTGSLETLPFRPSTGQGGEADA